MKKCRGRIYVRTQFAKFDIGKSIMDFHTVRIGAHREGKRTTLALNQIRERDAIWVVGTSGRNVA